MDIQSLKELTSTLKILYVEDDLAIAAKLTSILQTLFKYVLHVEDGEKGLMAYKKESFDIVLSDISMPNMNGIEMAKSIKKLDSSQVIIFSTAHSESRLLMEAINLNVDGYVLKPINHEYFLELLLKVSTKINNQKNLHYYQKHLEDLVKAKTQELSDKNIELSSLNKEIKHTLESTIVSLGGVAEARSHETGKHVKRVALYSEFIAQKIGLSKALCDTIRIISPMHDIGKLSIEDSILKKPGKLTFEEFEVMKEHARLGFEMLRDSNLSLFKDAAIVAYEHHEKYNGKGYPRGLKGEKIHIFGRITAFADVFDALISERIYKKPWSLEQIIALVHEERGEHFDPQICDIFFDNIEFFKGTNAANQDVFA